MDAANARNGDRSRSVDAGQHRPLPNLATHLVAIAMACLIAALLYALSVGPVFAYQCRHPEAHLARICPYYRPLFRVAPEATTRYLSWWEVSDVEAYFLLSTVQAF